MLLDLKVHKWNWQDRKNQDIIHLIAVFFGGRGLTKYNDFDCREVKYSQIPNVYVLNILRVAWTQLNNQIPVYSF